ncbi:hypothetical protein [Botryobacter ruber]|uniref:hypothetical protein n=1 Tax=Botryobacter ruber TaxID=2171629 RepID=UPI000F647EBE|nr:hypothetical protein [Botryobacter ruber]
MKLKSILATMLAVVMLTSCEDIFEDGMKPDGSKPYVTVNAPTANHSFTKANGVAVSLSVVDKDDVKDLIVQISDLNGEAPIVDFTKHFNKNVAILDTLVAQNQLMPGSYKLSITAKDKRSNVQKQEITFKVKE